MVFPPMPAIADNAATFYYSLIIIIIRSQLQQHYSNNYFCHYNYEAEL